MNLNAGCGGNKYAFYDLKCEINCDIQKPNTRIPSFILCDVQHLPFKDRVFSCVYAFNVLEHVGNYMKAENELKRVSNDEVLIRLDTMQNLADWFTSDHEGLAVRNTIISFPRTIKEIIRLVRFTIDHGKVFRKIVYSTFPVLRKMRLLDNWNYYRIK